VSGTVESLGEWELANGGLLVCFSLEDREKDVQRKSQKFLVKLSMLVEAVAGTLEVLWK
jgi:hypothetical protein